MGDDNDEGKCFMMKSINMVYNNIDCRVLNFQDMTTYLRLQRQEEKYRLIKMLNTSIHHEMIAPLKAMMDISKHLELK